MYEVQGQRAYITGQNGIYDGKVNNNSVRYGRNAADNNKKYLEDYTIKSEANYPDLSNLSQLSEDEFTKKLDELDDALNKTDEWLNKLPPTSFSLQYTPQKGQVDKMALMGAAYEEMDKRTEIPTAELDEKMKAALGEEATAEAVDLNKDKKIDLAEYSTSILLADIYSTDPINPAIDKADGTITNEGQDEIIPYSYKTNYDIAAKTYAALYQSYDLKNAQEEFKRDANNLVQ